MVDLTNIAMLTSVTDPETGREWKLERDGPNDREVDIWYNGSWVPAFFSDLLKGDFFLDVKMQAIKDNQCFLATSNVRRSVSPHSGNASFVIQGLEVVQAPAIKDINALHQQPVLELK